MLDRVEMSVLSAALGQSRGSVYPRCSGNQNVKQAVDFVTRVN